MAAKTTADIPALRRKRLQEWIEQKFDGSVNAFARAIGKPQPQIADMLREVKAFGEKVARDIEARAKMAPGYLDGADGAPSGVREKYAFYGLDISIEAARVGQEWDKLEPEMQGFVQTMIEVLVARKVKNKGKGKGKPPEDRPTA